MMATIRAEFCKLLTIRSTYIISLIGLLFGGFIAFYGFGMKGGASFPPEALQIAAQNITALTGTFVGVVAILAICHEYRYNTITYTLSISNNRLKVLLAKLLTVGVYAVIMAIITLLLAIFLTTLGAKMAGNDLGIQTIDTYSLLWRSLVYMVGGAWLGLVLGFLSRSLVFSIVMYFLIPSVEPILHALLKVNSNYMPSSSLAQVIQASDAAGMFSAVAAAGVFGLYLLAGLLASAVLFVRRDAS